MTAPAKGAALAAPETNGGAAVDVADPKLKRAFLDAYSKGQLDKLTPDQQARFLAALGGAIGVRPELGELMLYQGKPYITLAGYRRIAHASGLLVGLDTQPASSIQRRDFGALASETVWIARAYRRGSARPFTGWGSVDVTTDRNPVAKQKPREMAKKRAVYDALRLAFPPAEIVSAIHVRYIDAAEREAQATRIQAGPIAALDDDDPYSDGPMDVAEQEDEGPARDLDTLLEDDQETAARDAVREGH